MAYVTGDYDFAISHQLTDGMDIAVVTGSVSTTDTDPDHIAASIAAAWGASGSIVNVLGSNVNLLDVRTTALDGSLTAGFSDFSGADHSTGQGGHIAVSPQVAFVVTKQTGNTGRANRGRMFIPYLHVNEVNANNDAWSSSAVSDVTSAVDEWMTNLSVDSDPVLVWCLNSRSQSKLEVITTHRENIYLGTQRRRVQLPY